MKVLRFVSLVSASARYGGPSDTSLAQARLVASSGNDAVLVAGYFANDRPELPNLENVRVSLAPVRRLLPRSRFFLLGSVQFFKLLWSEIGKADVIHVSAARELLPVVALLMSRLRNKPYIAQPHGTLTTRTSWIHRLLDLAVKPLMRSADGIICLTHVEERDIRAWADGIGEITTIGNPVIAEPADHRGWSACDTDAVFIGRLHERKRAIDVVAAAEICQRNGWSDSYELVGPNQGNLNGYQHRIHACENVIYTGEVPPEMVKQKLATSKVFVLPSSNEPWGNVLVLALAMSIPVVVTESAALAPLVAAFEAGRVVPDGSPQAIAEAVHELVSDAQAYGKAAEGAVELTERHLANARVQAVLTDLYSRALASAKH